MLVQHLVAPVPEDSGLANAEVQPLIIGEMPLELILITHSTFTSLTNDNVLYPSEYQVDPIPPHISMTPPSTDTSISRDKGGKSGVGVSMVLWILHRETH